MRLAMHRNLNITKKRIFSFSETITIILFFLGAVNIFNRDTYCFFIAFAWFVLTQSRIVWPRKVMPILVFSFALMLFWKEAQYTVTTMLSAFTYPLCFFAGYNLLAKQDNVKCREQAFLILVCVLAAGTWLHMMLNAVANYSLFTSRNTIDIWSGEVRSATGQAGLGVMMIGLSIAILFSDSRRPIKIAAAIALGVVMWYNLILAGRTLILMAAITMLITLLYILRTKHKGQYKTLATALVVAIIVIIMYSFNIFGIQDVVVDSNLYQRFTGRYAEDVTDSGRMTLKLQFFRYLLDYPLGGAHIRAEVGGYAHDLYLDTYDEAGVFAFLAILVIVIQSIWTAYRLLRSKRFSYNTKLLVLCLFLCFHMEFVVEPILAGFDWMIMFYCMVYGAILCMVNHSVEEAV